MYAALELCCYIRHQLLASIEKAVLAGKIDCPPHSCSLADRAQVDLCQKIAQFFFGGTAGKIRFSFSGQCNVLLNQVQDVF